AWWWAEREGGGDAPRAIRRSVPTSSSLPPTTIAAPMPDIHAEWLIEENARPGSAASGIGDLGAPHSIEGFFDTTSATVGDVVRLFVSTLAAEWHVEAFRMGWYQGLGARLIWTSPTQRGVAQPPPTIDVSTNTVTANWTAPLEFPISGEFVEGCYLFKLVSSAGPARFVPLTIRDDANA